MARTQIKAKRSSSHAKARLEERLAPAVAERAYELLRDREELAELIALAAGDDPRIAESERVALALAPQDPCAHLVATRAGEGVTTLAAGMVHALPTVSFARVHALLDRRATLLQARIEVRKHVSEDGGSPLARALRYPHRVTREEFERLQKLAPLLNYLVGGYIEDAVQATIDVEPPRKPWSEQRLDKLWRLYMRGVLFLTVDGFDCPIQHLLCPVGAADIALSSRAIWHLANRPEQALEEIPRLHEQGRLGALSKLMLSVYALPALAIRHPAYHKDAKRLAATLAPEGATPPLSTASESRLLELAFPLVVHLPALVPAPLRDKREATKERMDRARRVALAVMKERGTDISLLELAEAISPWHGSTIRAWNPFAAIGATRQTRPRSTSTLDDTERVCVSMWRDILWERPLPIRGSEPWIALLVSLAPLEALAPLDEPDPALSLSQGRAYVTGRLSQMKRMAELAIEAQARVEGLSRSDAPLVARNAPCLCGSGKKYKRCCGPKQSPLKRRDVLA